MNSNHWGYGDTLPRFLTNEDHNVIMLKQIANPRNADFYSKADRDDAIAKLAKLGASSGGLRKSKSKRYRRKSKYHRKSHKKSHRKSRKH
jgi:hypothetical protein